MTKPVRIAVAVCLPALVAGLALAGRALLIKPPPEPDRYVPRPKGRLTFTKDVAPIVFNQCAPCHRPGQTAPFSLLDYAAVKKRAKQISEVTARRYMPPWPPEPGYGEFADARLLTADQIGVIQQWVAEGAVEGNRAELPPPRKWNDDWQLGPPDLVVKMPEPYTLGPEGKDVYRNFVIPIPTTSRKYVKAIEFEPGNRKIVHHAFIRLDPTRQSRRLDEQDPAPGFPGMHTPSTAQSPDGQFLSWQPGKVVARADEGLAWPLEKETDLVLQAHLQPTGKPEQIQPTFGFYFTDRPSSKILFKFGLRSLNIDIPAGEKNYLLEDSFVLPADVEVLAILPHAHFLGKELAGLAVLPDGARQWLFRIKNWDFNWQGEYRYAKPVALPKGTTLKMHYLYDNSTNNVRNPNQPPKPVRYGVQSTDEMGELWFQVQLRNTNELAALSREYQPRVFREAIAYNEYLLRSNPNDPKARTELGKVQLFLGRHAEAAQNLQAAAALQRDYDEPHYYLGLMFRLQKKLPDAQREFETAAQLNPENAKAHGYLGLIFLQTGDFSRAEQHFRSALQINPDDAIARESLEALAKAREPKKP